MIAQAIQFLRNQLNAHMDFVSSDTPSESTEDPVVFVDLTNVDPIQFKLNAVSVLLINVEQNQILRPDDPYKRLSNAGVAQKIQPDIRLNLSVLFVARFRRYEDGLAQLSQMIRFFQSRPVFNHDNAPELSDDIEQLVLELTTLPFNQQNEVWSALRTTYLPSLLYKVKMIVFRDENAVSVPVVTQKDVLLGLS